MTSLSNLRANVVTGAFVQLEWERGKGAEREFEVAWGKGSSVRLSANSSTATVTDLEPGTYYSFTVTTVADSREFKRSLHVRTASLRLHELWRNQLQVAWHSGFKNRKAVRMAYKVQWNITSRALSSNYTSNQTTFVNSTEAEILKIPVPHYARIAVCVQIRQQEDEWSRKICDSLTTPSGKPGKVRNLTVTPDDRSLRLTWEDPGDTPPTGELDRVSIDVSNTCKMLWTYNEPIHNLINGSGKWAFTVRHLQPDSDYTIEVRVWNKGSAGSDAVSRKARTLPGVPSPPRALLAIPWNTSQVLLSWAPPIRPQGILVNYTVLVDGKVDTCEEDTLQVHRCKIKGLTPGESYRTEVAACNRLHCNLAIAAEVAMPSARALPVWIPVLLAFLLLIVLGFLPFMLWRSKKLVDRLNERRRPGKKAVLASDKPAENQTPNPDVHVYDDPYTLGVLYAPQVSQTDSPLGEDQRQNSISGVVYANLPASTEHQYANIH